MIIKKPREHDPKQVVYICLCEQEERRPTDLVCEKCWKKVPRELKREFWDATKYASQGRGVTNNGKPTKRWIAAVRTITEFLKPEEDNAPTK